MDLSKTLQISLVIGLIIGIAVFLAPQASSAKRGKGVTLVFDGGASIHVPDCEASDFAKAEGGDLTNYCGGGSETLSRINFSKVVALCEGSCQVQ